jgi:glutamate-1-semialdehyde aminotransferase
MQGRARKRILGGYNSRAKGIEVWDDGDKYVDISINAAGACVLGYTDPDVDSAVEANPYL